MNKNGSQSGHRDFVGGFAPSKTVHTTEPDGITPIPDQQRFHRAVTNLLSEVERQLEEIDVVFGIVSWRISFNETGETQWVLSLFDGFLTPTSPLRASIPFNSSLELGQQGAAEVVVGQLLLTKKSR